MILGGIHPESSVHASASIEKDLKMIVSELVSKSQVFMYAAGHTHSSIKSKGVNKHTKSSNLNEEEIRVYNSIKNSYFVDLVTYSFGCS